MKAGRHKTLFIYFICLVLVFLNGCQMRKQADVGSEISGSSEEVVGELIKVDNSKGDIEKIVHKFIGMTVDEAVKKGAEYKEDSFYYEKGTTFFSYTGKSGEGLGPVIFYKDQYEMAADQYELAVGCLRSSTSQNLFDCGVRQVLPDEDLDSCKKEDMLEYCNSYAELLGYGSENSEVEVYAMTLDKLNSTYMETYGPLTGINNKEILSMEERIKVQKDYPWSKEYEAMYVVYKPYVNGLLLDSYYCSLQMIYVPVYGKIVYVFGEIPWEVIEVTPADSLISKADAIAETMLVNNITDKNDMVIDSVSLVYSMDITHLREDNGLDLCWRVNFKIENSAQYSGTDAYKTTLINAVTGEENLMWPGVNG